MNSSIQRSLLPLVLFLALNCVTIQRWTLAQSSVHVAALREVVLPVPYEELLGRLEGEEASRAMFRSQHVDLQSYVPQAGAESDDSDNSDDSVRAMIDITGCSVDFGLMHYTTSIVANKHQTTIDVALARPADMLLRDHYRYLIIPKGDEQSSVSISHSFDVRLMKRRLNLVNSIIQDITCKEASAQIQQLTSAMERSVIQLATSPASDLKSDANASEDAPIEDQSSENAEAESSDSDPSASEESSPSTIAAEPSTTTPSEKDLAVEAPLSSNTESPAPSQTADEAKASQVESPATTATPKASPKLTLNMRVTQTGKGAIRVAIFDSESQYKKFDARKDEQKQGDAFRKKEVKVGSSGIVECTFDDVPHGKYVIAAFHDIDGNLKLNSSFLGLPSEPYGFTRDARGQLGSPDYESAEIVFDDQHPEFEFTLK